MKRQIKKSIPKTLKHFYDNSHSKIYKSVYTNAEFQTNSKDNYKIAPCIIKKCVWFMSKVRKKLRKPTVHVHKLTCDWMNKSMAVHSHSSQMAEPVCELSRVWSTNKMWAVLEVVGGVKNGDAYTKWSGNFVRWTSGSERNFGKEPGDLFVFSGKKDQQQKSLRKTRTFTFALDKMKSD